MELNDNAKGTYIQLLIDSLKKKHEVLDELMQITTKQQAIIDSESFMEDEFLETISLKEEHIKDLDNWTEGLNWSMSALEKN